ncbi:hypothetical protein ACC691_39595, partial [Rhizobium johnstonii]|uniref:hypothetical protein n=1 Tax=Rhizobium johnstonii TaxID=3019933 RepID=UPI003F958E51
DVGHASNRAMRDADIAINQFRQDIRTDLRVQAVRGLVDDAHVALLRQSLAQVRADLLAAFRDKH